MKKTQVYDTLIKNLPVGFSIIDKDGVIVDFNHAAEKITGYLKKEVMASPISIHFTGHQIGPPVHY